MAGFTNVTFAVAAVLVSEVGMYRIMGFLVGCLASLTMFFARAVWLYYGA